MKNCELHARTIDEGGMDEKPGMNFSEYIAILSGDTTLLEKTKIEKKIAVLESLKTVHFKEITRTRYKLERLNGEKESATNILSHLTKDEREYKSKLIHEKDGTKANPIQLTGVNNIDSEVIGKHIVTLYLKWKPEQGTTEEKIGSFYGFDLHICQQLETFEDRGLFEYRHHNSFYVQHPEGEIKYPFNQGHPTVENPKLAARHFLNALNRVSKLKEQYEKNLSELNNDIAVFQNIITRPFEKEEELKSLKQELQKQEKEIALKIQKSQMQQTDEIEKEKNTNPVIAINTSQRAEAL